MTSRHWRLGPAALLALLVGSACVDLGGFAGNAGDGGDAKSEGGPAGGDGGADDVRDGALARDSGAHTCAQGCAVDETCIDDLCQRNPTPVGGAGAKIFGVNVTATNIIWSEVSAFQKKLIAGGAPTPLLTAGSTTAFTNDGTTLYWGNNSDLFSAPLQGGAIRPLATIADSPIAGVVFDGALLYFPVAATNDLRSMPLTGGPVTVCQVGLPRPTTIAISGSTLYVALADDTDPRIVTLPVGCAPTTAPSRLMSAPRGVDGLFVDPPNLWFTAFFDGSVYRAPADGSGPATRIAVKQDTLGQIVATKDAIYYAAGASVMRIPR